MMSSSTSRASRTSKDRTAKNQPSQHVKTDGTQKMQATAEQMRMAHIISDKNEAEDPEVQKTIKHLMDVTGRDYDSVSLALYDCDNDTNRAVEMLLEGNNEAGEWKETGKKKKRNQTKPESSPQNDDTDDREKSRERRDRGDSAPRGRRGAPPRMTRDGPPRLSRGGANNWRGRENEENEKNRADSRSRDRGFEGGRGRGKGQINGPGRGRGRGRGGGRFGGRFETNRFESDNINDNTFDKGPEIDTWTNETAENAEKENWGDAMTDDWTADEWTGSLEESKVFTPSVTTDTSQGPFGNIGDNDASIFQPPPMSVETQVFSSSITNSSMGPSLNDSANRLDTNSLGTSTLGAGSLTQNSLTQNSLGTSSLGQRLDLGILLPKVSSESRNGTAQSQFNTAPQPSAFDTSSESQYMSQFAKQATESIKNAMGIGSSTPSSQSVVVSSSPTPVQQSVRAPLDVPGSQQPQRTKPQRSKLPPPSKIPASAVEMPGHMNFNVDVQFGNWDFGSDGSGGGGGGGFSFGVGSSADPTIVTNSYTSSGSSASNATSSLSNHLPQVNSISTTESGSSVITNSTVAAVMAAAAASAAAASTQSNTSGYDSLSQSGGSSTGQSPRPGVYQASAVSTTPTKDYNKSSLSQSAKMSPPDPIPFPTSQTDRKSSPHYSQRSGQSQGLENGNISSGKAGSSPQMPYSQTGYSSSYQPSGYSSQKSSSLVSTSSYTHTTNNLTGVQAGLQNQLQGGQSQYGGYQSASFQNQSGYSSQGQNSLYQTSSQSNSFQSQSGSAYSQHQAASSYPNQSGSAYPSQTYQGQSASSYHHSRDSQSSGSAYQATVSQSGSSYQPAGASQSNSSYQTTVSQSSGSSYQRGDSQSNQSGFGSHQGYGSTNHQSGLQTSPMSANKLSDSLGKMSVKDSNLDQSSSQHTSYERGSSSSSTSTGSLTTTTTTTSASALGAGSSVTVSSALGLALTTAAAVTTTTITATAVSSTTSAKSALPATSKAPPNLPPGVPPIIGHNYMIGQPGMPFAAFGLAAAQQPMYSYEDLQLLQQRLPLPGYYDMPFQPPTTLAGRDQGTLPTTPYAGTENKLNRIEAQSPVQASTSQQQQQQQQQQTAAAHQQQAFISPATLPPGYNYYYPGGIVPGAGYSYTPTVFPVPSVTSATAHMGSTTVNTQFQKPGAYGSHAYGTGAYDDLAQQTAEFAKAYAAVTQTQAAAKGQGSVAGTLATATSTAADLTGTGYGKSHTQSFDKQSFHTGTPPPFSIPMPTGTQAGAMGAPTAAYGTPYGVPMMAHQPHSGMLHHHLQQDSAGGSTRGSQQTSAQGKPGAGKPYSTAYWGN